MYCKNLSKAINGKIKCKIKKQVITLQECKNCSKRNFKPNKGIKKISNNKITVSKETYKKVYERDGGICRICGSHQIQLHHILYRSERKDLIDEPNNCIMLCYKCHAMVHSNKKYWQSILQEKVKERI